MGVCKNCNASINYAETYCSDCIEYLSATNHFTYAQKWKYKISDGGCVGCRYICQSERKCEDCIRSHVPAPPYTDLYEKG